MHPQIQLPQPGKCPICFMDLIPVKQGDAHGDPEAVSLRQLTLSADARRLAEVETSPVERRDVGVETRMVGKVDYDETRVGSITARMGGRLDKLHVDYTGSMVKRGQPMASIYSPELLTAQAELIQAVKAIPDLAKSGLDRVRATAKRTEEAAREKLRLLGFSKAQIEKVVESGVPADHITLYAPMSGVVIEKDVVEGTYVQTGTRLYTIADLSRVWVVLEAYESDLPWIKLGQQADFQAEAYPGKVFRGKIAYIDPVVNEKTRTVRVRVNVGNRSGELKPGMFVKAVNWMEGLAGEPPLVVPASAPLITGKRAVVYVEAPGRAGTYEGREILLGPRAGDYYIVKQGLSEGERVVTRGGFKIDSAIQIMARPSMMNPEGGAAGGGHGHGGPDSQGSGGGHETPFKVPVPMASSLHHIAQTFGQLRTALEGRELDAVRTRYAEFRQALNAVDPAALTGRAGLLWKELSMVLGNDASLGAEAETLEEAGRLFGVLEHHFMRLAGLFPIEQETQARPVKKASGVPDAFGGQLGLALEAYLTLQAALAGDDFKAAKAAAEALAPAVEAIDMALLQDEAHRLWMEALVPIKEGIATLLAAEDITGLRSGFEPVSVGLARAVEGLGVQVEGPLFELSCPMAFENKGATWLQKDEDIRNPYFGAVMFKCGEVKRRLKGD